MRILQGFVVSTLINQVKFLSHLLQKLSDFLFMDFKVVVDFFDDFEILSEHLFFISLLFLNITEGFRYNSSKFVLILVLEHQNLIII